MTCPPRESDKSRTVIEAIPVDQSNGWWTGLVIDRDPDTGEIRHRLERWVENDHGYENPHTWRVRPDYWEGEQEAVQMLQDRHGRFPPGNLPINQRLTPVEYWPVRRDEVRRVVAVRLDRPFKGECIRLYHWDQSDESVRQKWTVGREWSRLSDLATHHVEITV